MTKEKQKIISVLAENLYLWPLAEGTLARKNSNKFGFPLAYSYLCNAF